VFATKPQEVAIPLPVKAGRLLSDCTNSWFGAFLCTSVFYPLLFLAAFLASRTALAPGKLGVAAAFAWSPLLALVLTSLPAGVLSEFS
jgi:hypothetical protein